MEQKLDVFVISLERDKDRRTYMRSQLDRLFDEYEFFPGIDGQTLAPELDAKWIDDAGSIATYGKPLTPGEKGCALSHILLWERIAKGDKPALILEDDVTLPENILTELIPPLLSELRSNRVILLRYLANSLWWKGKIPLQGVDFRLRKPNHKTLMAAAYLVTPDSARKLVDHLQSQRLTHPNDWWYRPDGHGFTRVVDTWVTSRELIHSNYEFESLIDASEGDRDGLKVLGAPGRIKRSVFLLARRCLFPVMRLFRSYVHQPIWPKTHLHP